MKILAVTACPSGVAHTYMAAEALKNACSAEQIECKVETQGSIGVENAITAEDLADATAVVLTNDMPIKDIERFADLPKIKLPAATVIKSAPAIVAKITSELD